MGILANQYGSFSILVVMAKLPADVYLQIAQVTTNDICDQIWEKPATMHTTARHTFHHQTIAVYTLTNNSARY